MSRFHRPWYERPNKPPENWYKPHEPAIRKVTGDDDTVPQDRSPFRTLTLPAPVWINILRALYLYEASHGTPESIEWRLAVRRIILEKVKAVPNADQRISIEFSVNNWRRIWKALRQVVGGRDASWQRWFRSVSAEMTRQIRTQENKA